MKRGVPLNDEVPELRLIDLAPDQEGAFCLICAAMGHKITARLVDRENGPVCISCFSELLNLEAKLAFANYQARISGGEA